MIYLSNYIKKRIDSLGRIVIPKQFRDELRINDFDDLKMNINDDCIILKKSVNIEKYKKKFDRLLLLLNYYLDFSIVVTDKDNYIIAKSNNIDLSNLNVDSLIDISMLNGYTEVFPIIVDINNLGHLYFVKKDKFNVDTEVLKILRDIFIDLIN